VRTPNDLAPHNECPRCGIIYAKYENRVEKETHSYPKHESIQEKSSSPALKVMGALFFVCCFVTVYFVLVPKPISDISKSTNNAPKSTSDIPEMTNNVPNPTSDVPEETTNNVPNPTSNIPEPINDAPKPTNDLPKRNSTKDTQVTLLSTTRCGYCKLAKNYLDKHNINYIELDVEQSEEGRRLYNELNGRGVPIILIGDTRINGYDEEILKQVLQKENLL
jgi:glutaredoxin